MFEISESKLKQSINCKEKLVYLADRRIVDFNGNLVGFFDTGKSMTFGEKPGFIVTDERGYVSAKDFKDLNHFKCVVESFCKCNGVKND